MLFQWTYLPTISFLLTGFWKENSLWHRDIDICWYGNDNIEPIKVRCCSHHTTYLEIQGLAFYGCHSSTWWRHQMETISVLLAICAGNSPVNGEFPTQRPVTRSFDVFSDLHLNKWLSKQSWGWWFETLSCPLWRHYNGTWTNSVEDGWGSGSHNWNLTL